MLRKANDRGSANFGWLKSKHSFSFGHYYDPKHTGFSALRVINDDRVTPGAGFSTHGHRDMEIISYVLDGAIEHQDNVGNVQTLPAGEFQLMSAGKGIFHSEYNASKSHHLRFLQIWIEPSTFGNKPSYQQKAFGQAQGLTTIVTPTGEANSLQIKQNMKLHQLILAPNTEAKLDLSISKNAYVHQVKGKLIVEDTLLEPGDGAKVQGQNQLLFRNTGKHQVTAIVFELP